MTVSKEILAELVEKTVAIGRSAGADDTEIALAFARGMAGLFDCPKARGVAPESKRARGGTTSLEKRQMHLTI